MQPQSIEFTSGFKLSLARELTTEVESYSNYPTSDVVNFLQHDSRRVKDSAGLLEEALVQVKSEEVLTLAYVYSDLIARYVREDLLLEEEDILGLAIKKGRDACAFTAHAADFYLGLVNWNQITVRLISDYEDEDEDEVILLTEEERKLSWS